MITIIDITPDSDIPKLIREIDSAIWSPKSEINIGDYTEETLSEYVKTDRNVFCVAYMDDAFAGIASAYVLTKPEGERWLYVDEVDTVQNKQRKGVGTALMRHLLDYATKNDCQELWLGTETDNVSAQVLYRSLIPDEVQNFTGFTYTLKK